MWSEDENGTGENKKPLESYHLPDRTFSDFYCKVCISHMNNKEMWASHIQGKRHQKNVKKVQDAPNSMPIDLNEEIPVIESKLADINDEPIVGLKYISEIRKANQLLGPTYKCFLCSAYLATGDILIDHLYTVKHKFTYIRQVDKKGYDLMNDLGFSKDSLSSLIADHAAKLEQLHGRGQIQIELEKTVVGTQPKYPIYEDDSPPRRAEKKSIAKFSHSMNSDLQQSWEKNLKYERRAYNRSSQSLFSFSDSDDSCNSEDKGSFRDRSPNYHCRSPDRTSLRRSKSRGEQYKRTPYRIEINRRQYQDLREKLKHALSSPNSPRCRDMREKMERALFKSQEPLPRRSPRDDQSRFKWSEKGHRSRDSLSDLKLRSEYSSAVESVMRSRNVKPQQAVEFLREMGWSPSTSIRLLEKMAYRITSDYEYRRLEEIAKRIQASIENYK